ncbi:MAG: hypothetical protein U5Q03_17495 [Bacteroidota bacterium]|nr:hypothetical protein [Bacteroidota bacterium]
MPPELKSELFRQIFLDLGIGAKTNTGYGQLKRSIGTTLTGKDGSQAEDGRNSILTGKGSG